jgi:hypothetical protein
MKKLKFIISALLIFALSLTFIACGKSVSCGAEEDDVTVINSYVANYTKGDVSVDVVLNCVSDGSADVYVAYVDNNELKGTHYKGTWQSGENSDGDDTISFTYNNNSKDISVSDATVLVGVFTAENIYLSETYSSVTVTFYQTASIELSGTSYVGYLKKNSGMGEMVYAYILNLESDNTFSVSVLQNTPYGNATGVERGTYAVSGDEITFTYDVLDDDDDDGTADVILEDGKGYVSKGTSYSENGFSVGLQIGQVNAKASSAQFVKITK